MATRSPVRTGLGTLPTVVSYGKFVRTHYNVPPAYATAASAWSKTRDRHGSTPPKGVPVWWTGGSRGFGHVAISAGGGFVIRTDTGGRGRVGRTDSVAMTPTAFRAIPRCDASAPGMGSGGSSVHTLVAATGRVVMRPSSARPQHPL
jgi:hypothetical protein